MPLAFTQEDFLVYLLIPNSSLGRGMLPNSPPPGGPPFSRGDKPNGPPPFMSPRPRYVDELVWLGCGLQAYSKSCVWRFSLYLLFMAYREIPSPKYFFQKMNIKYFHFSFYRAPFPGPPGPVPFSDPRDMRGPRGPPPPPHLRQQLFK